MILDNVVLLSSLIISFAFWVSTFLTAGVDDISSIVSLTCSGIVFLGFVILFFIPEERLNFGNLPDHRLVNVQEDKVILGHSLGSSAESNSSLISSLIMHL